MLQIEVPAGEFWDSKKERFLTTKPITLTLEHSLVSLSKWEAKWCKPFLVKDPPKTSEETIDYIKCMTLTQNVDPRVYSSLSEDNLEKIRRYIEAPMTATTINSRESSHNREIITSELIYYWMIALNIPFECQKWHLNRLLMLINVCNVKNRPPKKMSANQLMSRNAALNAARRKRLNSKG